MGAWKTSHPGVPPPSRRCLPSWSEPIDQGARPTRPASEAQSPRKRGALGLHERRHAPATSARPAGTTDPSLQIRPSTVCQLPLLNATPTFEALVIVLRHAPEDFSHLGAHRFHEKPTSSFVVDLSERS